LNNVAWNASLGTIFETFVSFCSSIGSSCQFCHRGIYFPL